MPVSVEGKKVLVVGASSGCGRATAVQFAREGARVMASARRKDRLEQLRDELASEGKQIEIYPADASVVAEMNALAAAARETLGGLDIVVYSTGTNTKDRYLERLTPEIWDMMVTTNLSSAFYLTQAVLPAMREQKSGHLIFVSSISGKYADVSGSSYQAAKRGLVGLSHAIRVEQKQYGIRTCVVCPGLIDTELLEKRPVKPDADTLAKALQPEDVADAIIAVAKMNPRASIPELDLMPAAIQ